MHFRDFLIVALIVDDEGRVPDNWLYIHDPEVRVARVQNFKAWSPEMVPDSARACYGMEYFCSEGDHLWSRSDDDLVVLAGREAVALGLCTESALRGGFVVRQPRAYPVYDAGYEERVACIRAYVEEYCPGLHLVGRNGMHCYNSQDHAMMTGILTAENILAGERRYDVWRVNQETEYAEEQRGSDITTRLIPQRVAHRD